MSTEQRVYFEKVTRHLLAAGFDFQQASDILKTFDGYICKQYDRKPPKQVADEILGG
jgi:hypothetical protein